MKNVSLFLLLLSVQCSVCPSEAESSLVDAPQLTETDTSSNSLPTDEDSQATVPSETPSSVVNTQSSDRRWYNPSTLFRSSSNNVSPELDANQGTTSVGGDSQQPTAMQDAASENDVAANAFEGNLLKVKTDKDGNLLTDKNGNIQFEQTERGKKRSVLQRFRDNYLTRRGERHKIQALTAYKKGLESELTGDNASQDENVRNATYNKLALTTDELGRRALDINRAWGSRRVATDLQAAEIQGQQSRYNTLFEDKKNTLRDTLEQTDDFSDKNFYAGINDNAQESGLMQFFRGLTGRQDKRILDIHKPELAPDSESKTKEQLLVENPTQNRIKSATLDELYNAEQKLKDENIPDEIKKIDILDEAQKQKVIQEVNSIDVDKSTTLEPLEKIKERYKEKPWYNAIEGSVDSKMEALRNKQSFSRQFDFQLETDYKDDLKKYVEMRDGPEKENLLKSLNKMRVELQRRSKLDGSELSGSNELWKTETPEQTNKRVIQEKKDNLIQVQEREKERARLEQEFAAQKATEQKERESQRLRSIMTKAAGDAAREGALRLESQKYQSILDTYKQESLQALDDRQLNDRARELLTTIVSLEGSTTQQPLREQYINYYNDIRIAQLDRQFKELETGGVKQEYKSVSFNSLINQIGVVRSELTPEQEGKLKQLYQDARIYARDNGLTLNQELKVQSDWEPKYQEKQESRVNDTDPDQLIPENKTLSKKELKKTVSKASKRNVSEEFLTSWKSNPQRTVNELIARVKDYRERTGNNFATNEEIAQAINELQYVRAKLKSDGVVQKGNAGELTAAQKQSVRMNLPVLEQIARVREIPFEKAPDTNEEASDKDDFSDASDQSDDESEDTFYDALSDNDVQALSEKKNGLMNVIGKQL